MKKVGIVLIILQVLGLLNGIFSGTMERFFYASLNSGAYGIFRIVGYFLIGIIGIRLYIVARKKERRSKQKDDIQRRPTMFCKNCGSRLPDKSKFCHNCGASVEKEKVIYEYEQNNAEQIDDTSILSPNSYAYRQPLNDENAINNNIKKKSNKSLIIILSVLGGLIGLFAIILIVALAVSFSKPQSKKTENKQTEEVAEDTEQEPEYKHGKLEGDSYYESEFLGFRISSPYGYSIKDTDYSEADAQALMDSNDANSIVKEMMMTSSGGNNLNIIIAKGKGFSEKTLLTLIAPELEEQVKNAYSENYGINVDIKREDDVEIEIAGDTYYGTKLLTELSDYGVHLNQDVYIRNIGDYYVQIVFTYKDKAELDNMVNSFTEI